MRISSLPLFAPRPACGCLHELVLALGDSDLKAQASSFCVFGVLGMCLQVRRAAAHALAGLGEGSATEAVVRHPGKSTV